MPWNSVWVCVLLLERDIRTMMDLLMRAFKWGPAYHFRTLVHFCLDRIMQRQTWCWRSSWEFWIWICRKQGCWPWAGFWNFKAHPHNKSTAPNTIKECYTLLTKYSNLWAYKGSSHSNTTNSTAGSYGRSISSNVFQNISPVFHNDCTCEYILSYPTVMPRVVVI